MKKTLWSYKKKYISYNRTDRRVWFKTSKKSGNEIQGNKCCRIICLPLGCEWMSERSTRLSCLLYLERAAGGISELSVAFTEFDPITSITVEFRIRVDIVRNRVWLYKKAWSDFWKWIITGSDHSEINHPDTKIPELCPLLNIFYMQII